MRARPSHNLAPVARIILLRHFRGQSEKPDQQGSGRDRLMTRFVYRSLLFFAMVTMLEVKPAAAEDLGAGKSARQLFASNCSMCHATPRSPPRRTDNSSLADFLQEHYTSNRASADELAGYLLVVNSNIVAEGSNR